MEWIAGRIVLLWGWRRAAVAFLAGAFAVLAQAPFDFVAAAFVSFPVLVWLLDGAAPDPRGRGALRSLPAFLIGWWFGFGYFLAGLWWIGNALLVEAEVFAWALPLAVLILPACLAVFYGAAAAFAHLFWGHEAGRILALAAGFGLFEWLRTFLFTGFPWNAIGYAAMPVPLLMQPVAAVGMNAMNLLAVFLFAAPALLAGRRHGLLAAALLMAAAGAVYGFWRLSLPEPEGRPVPVRIVQPSIDQAGKWDRELRDRIFRLHLDLSTRDAGNSFEPQLVVWPETAVPFLFEDRPDALAAIGGSLREGQVLLAGAVRSEGEPGSGRRFYNAILAIGDDGEVIAAADKVHLVPFGEYLPLAGMLESLGLRRLVVAPGSFSAAPERSLIELFSDLLLVPLICYEIIFPHEVGRLAPHANMIVNLTNDAWYGDTPGPYQHFRQARIRAVETGLPLIRSANNGISAAVDSRGRIIDALALNEVGSIDAMVIAARIPIFSDHGLTFAVILLSFSACAAMLHRRARIQAN